MNLCLPYLAYCISYRVMDWAGFSIHIPVVVDVGLSMDSHIDVNPEVCKNLR